MAQKWAKVGFESIFPGFSAIFFLFFGGGGGGRQNIYFPFFPISGLRSAPSKQDRKHCSSFPSSNWCDALYDRSDEQLHRKIEIPREQNQVLNGSVSLFGQDIAWVRNLVLKMSGAWRGVLTRTHLFLRILFTFFLPVHSSPTNFLPKI